MPLTIFAQNASASGSQKRGNNSEGRSGRWLPDSLPFRVRDPERDARTDSARLEQLKTLVETTIREITREREGLRARLERNVGDAAFLMQALENEDVSKRQSARVGALEQAIIYANKRELSLREQLDHLRQIENVLNLMTAEKVL